MGIDTEKPLTLYEDTMLLALHDQMGTPVVTGYMHAVCTAMMFELLNHERVRVGSGPKHLVEVISSRNTGDPLLDELLAKIIKFKRQPWFTSFVNLASDVPNLKYRICSSLAERGILKKVERKYFWFFKQQVWPESRRGHKDELRQRLEDVMFDENTKPDPRTASLISIACNSWLLQKNFSAFELHEHRKRIRLIMENVTQINAFDANSANLTAANMMMWTGGGG